MSSEGPPKQKNICRDDDPLPDSPEKFRGESSEGSQSPSKSENIADDDDEVQEALKFNNEGKYGLSKHEQVLSPEQQFTSKKLVPELISKSMNSYQNFDNTTLSPINLPGPRKVVGIHESILRNSQQSLFGKIFK